MNKLISCMALCFLWVTSAHAELSKDMFIQEDGPYVHYTVKNQEAERYPSSDRFDSAPCNYHSNNAQVICYNEEVKTMNAFFKRVPAKLNAKDPSGKLAAKFKREQRAFEKRVHPICEKISKASYGGLGVAATLHPLRCYYEYYEPRYVKIKRMLGEPHPVRRKTK